MDARRRWCSADIAATAVRALVDDGHAGRSYEVKGPRALSFADAVGIIEREAGRPVRFLGDDADFVASMQAAGVPVADAEGALAAFASLRAAGDDIPNDDVLRVTGRAPKDFETYAREAAARGAWSASPS